MMTTSLRGSLLAISALSWLPFRPANQAHRRMRGAVVVGLDPVAKIVAGAREADHRPAGHVAVAAINGIGEEALLGVLQQEREEGAALGLAQHLPLRHRLDQPVLLLGGELVESLAGESLAAMVGKAGQRGAIALRRGGRGLLALFGSALAEWRTHEQPGRST